MLLDKNIQAILNEFSDDYHKRIYGRDVAKKTRMNQKTVSNILNRLEKENILKFSIEGKNKYYFLNDFNTQIREVIKLIEIGRKMSFLEKNKKIRDLFEKLEKRTNNVLIVFGSYAKNTNNEKSDLDLFVFGKTDEIEDLEDLYKIKINIIKSSREKFNKEEPLIKEVIKNHVILKGMEEFIELI